MVAKKINYLVIVGPTASGKTGLAIKLAKNYNGEVISADSRAIYKKMDIGTAKPSKNEQQGIKHWGLDMVGPGENFTVSDFKKFATKIANDIKLNGKLPILVGGSGLYVDSVLYDFSFAPPDLVLRKELQDKTVEELQQIIKDKHLNLPENYKNKRYLIRAIEIGGFKKIKKPIEHNIVILGINPDKEDLKKRIELRLETMLADGVVQEIKTCASTYGWESTAMTGGIYRAFKGYIEGEEGLEFAKKRCIKSDLDLAKKQMTWFKRNKYIKWFKTADEAWTWFNDEFKGKL